MSSQPLAVDARSVTPEEVPLAINGRRSTLWLGMAFILVIEFTVFSSLIASYFYLKYFASEWPVGGIEEPSVLLPTIGTVLLLLSSAPIHWGDTGMRQGNRRRMQVGLALGFALAVAFLGLKLYEYSGVDYRWSTNAYGSIVWTIIGFHSAHVTALLLKTVVVLAASSRGYFSSDRNIGVQINGIYWHFVVVIWVPLYATLYLSHLVL